MDSVITIASNLDTCCTVIREIMKHFDKVRIIISTPELILFKCRIYKMVIL